jgi:hypothetical protein
MFCSSKNLITPAWAIPLEPPPESTNPIDFVFKSIFFICDKITLFVELKVTYVIFMLQFCGNFVKINNSL